MPVVDNNDDPARRINSNLCDKLDAKRSMNFKICKKSEITIPPTKTIKNYFTMDLKALKNQEKFINITEDFLLKKDQGSMQQNNELFNIENKINPDFQSIACGTNELDLVKSMNLDFVKTSAPEINCDIEIKVPSENLEEVIKTEKTSHFLSKGFTGDTLEKIVKVIDDPFYEGNDLKKTLSGIIKESKEARMQYFHSRGNSVITEHNYVKICSIGNDINSNPNYNSKVDLYNEILDKNNSQINNTASNFSLFSNNINDGNNNIADNKSALYSSDKMIHQVNSSAISCIKVNSNPVQTITEELMNTQQFLQDSIDINYSQNTISSDIPGNDLNSISLAKITKCQKFKGNKVTNVKSHDLDFSDLNWS